MDDSHPRFIFDGECGVCRFWMRRWRAKLGDRVEFQPFQDVHKQYPDIPLESFQHSAKLIEPDGTVHHAAASVLKLVSMKRRRGLTYWLYQYLPPFRFIAEKVYRVTADHRPLFSKFTRFFWGDQAEPPGYSLTAFIFLRALAVIYFIAFLSLLMQLSGLYGNEGILPIQNFLNRVTERTGAERYWLYPTLTWLSAGDWFLYILAGGGLFCSLLLFFHFAPLISAGLLWILYLSFVAAGQIFLSYQWDILLLEAGFLALFLTPLKPSLRFQGRAIQSVLVLWLFRWLNFRLLFESGIAKLASGDQTWHNLTALTYHYETQPIPNLPAWVVHQLPAWFDKLSAVLMFGIEVGIPFLFFLPRRPRFFGAFAAIFLQAIIILTGNYTYFNFLAIAIALMLFDDEFWRSALSKLRRGVSRIRLRPPELQSMGTVTPLLLVPFAIFAFAVGGMQIYEKIQRKPVPLYGIRKVLRPLHLVNSYGLFANMTTERPELIVQGSRDGETWKTYDFRYKPDFPDDRPRQVAPHQPRLDWQMWFSALTAMRSPPGNPRYRQWLISFVGRLLQGEQSVTRLLANNPFPENPPRYIRIQMYDFQFSSFETLRNTGEWWQTRFVRTYLRPVERMPQGLRYADQP